MIKFFRHIRKSLISENKMGKYFKYAIGEILLVVIGILIALTINNWNEERKNRDQEKLYLKDVYEDFTANKIQFDNVLNWYREQLRITDSLRGVGPITNQNWNNINKNISRAFRPMSFDPKNSSIETLISSGNIDLVQNDSLKKLLLSWKDQYLDYKEEEDGTQFHIETYREVLLNEPSWQDWKKDLPITDDLKIKLRKLLQRRRGSLNLLLGKWSNQESAELMKTIDAIISLTSPYAQ
jgi:hypothetical protein